MRTKLSSFFSYVLRKQKEQTKKKEQKEKN